MSGNPYYIGQTSAQVRVALSQDIPALYAAIVAPAAPSALVGLAAVPGAAITFMRSDAAPALDPAITPTWTGAHTFRAAASPIAIGGISYTGALTLPITNTSTVDGDTCRIVIGAGATSFAAYATNVNQSTAIVTGGPTGAQAVMRTLGAQPIVFGTNNTYRGQFSGTGGLLVAGALGINGNAAPAQPTGYGTPTGGAHQASFAAGSITLPNLAAAVAQLIIELKAYGLIAA